MHYSIIHHNFQKKYVRQFTPKPQIIIRGTNVALPGTNVALPGTNVALPGTNVALPGTNVALPGTNVALRDIEYSFKLELDRLPPNSLLALINKHRNFYTRNAGNIAPQTIQLDFSDGIIKLIEMYFFEKDSKKKTIVNKKFPCWTNPTMPNDKDIYDDITVTANDLFILNYPTVLGLKTQWITNRFRTALSDPDKDNMRLLPTINNRMYPTATFIKVLAEYLLLNTRVYGEFTIWSYKNDYRIVNKIIKSNRPRKNVDKFANSVDNWMNRIIFLYDKIKSELDLINKSNVIKSNPSDFVTINFMISLLYDFFEAIHITNKKCSSNLCCDEVAKRQINKIFSVYDPMYVYHIEMWFYRAKLNAPMGNVHSRCRFYGLYKEKNCNCCPIKNSKLDWDMLCVALLLSYIGCNCTDIDLQHGDIARCNLFE